MLSFQKLSIVQNIAEGAGRVGRADKARHYAIARGSAMESAGHLDVMKIEEIIEEATYVGLRSICSSAWWRCSRR